MTSRRSGHDSPGDRADGPMALTDAVAIKPGGGAPALAARAVSKRFPGVLANDRANLEVLPGEVHALLGENGSGKTTLCKMLTGLYRPDSGAISVDGRRIELASPADAFEAGIFMVHQHFSLVDPMTVAENVVLGWSRRRGLGFRRQEVEDEVARAAEELHVHVDPRAAVWQLSVGERQRVEILKALYRGARILLLDEPTTVLTPQESEQLFVSIRRMADAGGSVVFISHKLHEVLAVCDRVTVLREGRTVETVDVRDGQVDSRQLARLMVGREMDDSERVARGRPASRESVLEIRDLVARNDFGREVVKGVSLAVRAGEIVGIAGVAGNGQRELADAVCGVVPRARGSVMVAGEELASGDARAAIERGVAYVPEDRMGVGLAPNLPVAENLVLKAFREERFTTGPFVRRRRVVEHARGLLELFNVKGSADSLVRQLSGGNAQKVLLARELSSTPRVLVAASPTRGLDVAAMTAVRRIVTEAAESGVGVLMISEDLDELLDLADRIAVMCDGRVTGVVERRDADREQIGMLMMGQEAEALAQSNDAAM